MHFSYYNTSILALPAYVILTMVPHVYSVVLARRHLPGDWDNANPRGTAQSHRLQKHLPPHIFRRFERARGAHQNFFENLPVFFSAIILGNLARIPLDGMGGMSWFAKWFLLLRTMHLGVYLWTDSRLTSFLRGLFYIGSMIMCLWIFVKCAGEMVY